MCVIIAIYSELHQQKAADAAAGGAIPTLVLGVFKIVQGFQP